MGESIDGHKTAERNFWGEFKGASLGNLRENSFLYGSIVIYYARNHIYFENEMISSGTMVHEWTSSFNFQGNRLTPTLPLIKKVIVIV